MIAEINLYINLMRFPFLYPGKNILLMSLLSCFADLIPKLCFSSVTIFVSFTNGLWFILIKQSTWIFDEPE